MPSGSITVTPGTTVTSTTEIDEDVLNDLALPAMVVAADAVGLREIADLGDITDAVAEGAVSRNAFQNPMFDRDQAATAAALSCPTTHGTQVAPGWHTQPAGATVTTQHGAFTVAGATSAAALIITGGISVTEVNLWQYLPAYLTRRFDDAGSVTISFTIQNTTTSSLTPTLRIDTSDTTNDRDTLTNEVSTAGSALASGTVAVRSWTVDWSALTNGRNGARISLRFPSGSLNSASKSVRVGAPILVPGTEAGEWGYFPDRATGSSRGNRRHSTTATTDPGPTNDRSEGWSVGSVWRNGSSGDRFQCVRDIADSALWVKLTKTVENYTLWRYERTSSTPGGATNFGTKWPPTGQSLTEVCDTAANWAWVTGATETAVASTRPALQRATVAMTIFDSGVAKVQGDFLVLLASNQTASAHRLVRSQVNTASIQSQIVKWAGITPSTFSLATTPNKYGLNIYSQCTATKATNGYGPPASFGVEVYGFQEMEEIQIPTLGNAALPETTNANLAETSADLVMVVIEENIDIASFLSVTIQGTLVDEDGRILLIGQDDPAENGVYVWQPLVPEYHQAGAQENAIAEVMAGNGAGRMYQQIKTITTIGTDPQQWVPITAPRRVAPTR